jgi:drug/metabolite transporter (DMT)-like permease
MWFISAVFAGILFTASNLLTRHILKGNKDSWAFSFYYSAIGALVSLPFALNSLSVPNSFPPWALMVVVGLLIVVQNFLNFRSSNFIPASITGTINKFRLVWVFVLGLLLSLEVFNVNKVIGIIFTVIAGIILMYKQTETINKKGILYAFTSTFFYAVVIVLYQYLFKSFNSQTLTLFIFVFPALINLILMPNRFVRIKNLYIAYRAPLIIACGCGGLGNLAMNYALAQGNSTSTLVIIEAFLIVTLVLESMFLKERGNLVRKVIATLLAVIGAVIIRLA